MCLLPQVESRPCLMLGTIDRLLNRMLQRTTSYSLALVAVTAFLKTGMCPASKCPASKCPASKCPASKGPASKCPASKCPASKCPAAKCPATEGSFVVDAVAICPASSVSTLAEHCTDDARLLYLCVIQLQDVIGL